MTRLFVSPPATIHVTTSALAASGVDKPNNNWSLMMTTFSKDDECALAWHIVQQDTRPWIKLCNDSGRETGTITLRLGSGVAIEALQGLEFRPVEYFAKSIGGFAALARALHVAVSVVKDGALALDALKKVRGMLAKGGDEVELIELADDVVYLLAARWVKSEYGWYPTHQDVELKPLPGGFWFIEVTNAVTGAKIMLRMKHLEIERVPYRRD